MYLHSFCILLLLNVAFCDERKSYNGCEVIRIKAKNHNYLKDLFNFKTTVLKNETWCRCNIWRESDQIDVMLYPDSPVKHYLDTASIFPYQTIIEDVEKVCKQEYPTEWPTFYNQQGFDDRLRTIANGNSFSEIVNIGQTFENRSTIGVKVTFNDANNKSFVLIRSDFHARAWMPQYVVAELYNTVLAAQKSNSSDFEILSKFNYFFMPTMNADGYEYTWNTDRLWINNRRAWGDDCKGVNLVENMPFRWKKVPIECAVYGPHALSEPEARIHNDFLRHYNGSMIAALVLASYGEEIASPFNRRVNLTSIAQDMCAAIKKTTGEEYRIILVNEGHKDIITALQNLYDVPYSFFIFTRDKGKRGYCLTPEDIVPSTLDIYTALLELLKHVLASDDYKHRN